MQHALVAALAGSLASVVGKCAFDPSQIRVARQLLCTALDASFCQEDVLEWSIRIALVVVVLALNTLMLNQLVRSMQVQGTLSAATSVNALSFCLSGLFGWFFFNESIKAQWFAGVSLVLCGVYLLKYADESDGNKYHVAPSNELQTSTKQEAETEPPGQASKTLKSRRGQTVENVQDSQEKQHHLGLRLALVLWFNTAQYGKFCRLKI
eukprot:g6487.t1